MSNSVLNSAIKKTSRKLSVDQKMVELIYRSYWKFIKEHISSMDMKEMSQEEFNSVVTNFNIPYLGKLYVVYGKIEHYKRKQKLIEDAKVKNDQASRLSGTGD